MLLLQVCILFEIFVIGFVQYLEFLLNRRSVYGAYPMGATIEEWQSARMKGAHYDKREGWG
jgi:hypothetical protein